jgi:DNA-binding beta-propeller fold protein YncE
MRRVWGVVSGLALMVSGCGTTSVTDPFEQTDRVWPEAPSLARIALVGEFATPTDLGISGSVWARIVSFTAGGGEGRLVRPMAVAVSVDGRKIYVADPDAGCVHRFDIGRNRYRCLAPRTREGIAAPVGLAMTDDGHVFVTDSLRAKIWQVEEGGKYLEAFEVSAALDQPTGVFWEKTEQVLYVTDTVGQAVLQFDRLGNLKQTIGVRGTGPGQFNFPTYLWIDPNRHLLVTDSLNFRLQRFDADGNHLKTFGIGGDRPGDFARPKGVATDSLGHVYIVDALLHTIQIFDAEGRLLLAVGEQGQGKGQFWLPNGIFISEDNTIYVTDAYNRRVQVFRYVGPTT